MRALVYHLGCQRDITGNHQVALSHPFDNFIVGNIKTLGNLDHADIGYRRNT